LEVERHDRQAAAALQAARGLPLVGREAIEADAQEGAEARLRRIVAVEELLLDRAGEKFLGGVARLVARGVPLHAQMFVYRPPVDRNQRLEPAAPHRFVAAADGGEDRMARRGQVHLMGDYRSAPRSRRSARPGCPAA